MSVEITIKILWATSGLLAGVLLCVAIFVLTAPEKKLADTAPVQELERAAESPRLATTSPVDATATVEEEASSTPATPDSEPEPVVFASRSTDTVPAPARDSSPSVRTVPAAPAPAVLPVTATQKRDLEWGAYVGYSAADLEAFETMVGTPVDIRAVFVDWHDPFPASFAANLKPKGKTMVIFWEQYSTTLTDILNGSTDAYIRQFAEDARAYGGKVILSPLHEMNGDWDPWGGPTNDNTPERIIEVWRHIHEVFGDVPNVYFAWTVNNMSVPNTPENAIERYYPGDAYVDYVTVDGFNFANPWQTFTEVFHDALTRLSQYGKPMYILSTASAEGPLKDEWIYDGFGDKIYKYPGVVGWVWFNQNKERDWRVNSSPESLEAFKAVIPK